MVSTEQDDSEMWLRFLRETAKKADTPYCRYCPYIREFPSEEALLDHLRNAHPEKVSEPVIKVEGGNS
jgi:hypothetical protein